MKTKETKIRESWIAEIGEEKYNEVKEYIDDYGYLRQNLKDTLSGKVRFFKLYGSMARPKSLSGIETNNGWHRIDEVGLPKEEGAYVIIDFSTGKALNYLEVNNMHAVRIYHYDSGHTHWRKKEVYPDPHY